MDKIHKNLNFFLNIPTLEQNSAFANSCKYFKFYSSQKINSSKQLPMEDRWLS